MPFGLSWPQYGQLFGATLAGIVAGSQTVHKFYKPLEGLEELAEEEYQKLLMDLPPERKLSKMDLVEERVAEFDAMHKALEEYEKKKQKKLVPPT